MRGRVMTSLSSFGSARRGAARRAAADLRWRGGRRLVRAKPPRRLSALGAFHSKSFFYGAFARARGALKRPKHGGFPARGSRRGMGLSAEEAAASGGEGAGDPARQARAPAGAAVSPHLRRQPAVASSQLLPAASCCQQPAVASCCQQPAVGSSCCRHPIVASSQLLSAASQRQPTRVGCWLG